jgi:myo-inositol-1-phosphate synthase
VTTSKVRTAIVGVGNCASSFVQDVEFYRGANSNDPGVLDGPSGYFMKSPPRQFTDSEARARTEAFIRGEPALQ